MKKFDWEEFQNASNKIAVHCETEEEAIDFCKQMHEHGLRWADEHSYLERSDYNCYLKYTCYSGYGTFADWWFYHNEGFTILEWSDYMKKEFTKADLKDGMVVEYRNLSRRVVIGNSLIGENDYNILDNYNDMLLSLNFSDHDIIKIYEIKQPSAFSVMMKNCNLRLIWNRFNTKCMTVEEMRKKLEELTGSTINIIGN